MERAVTESLASFHAETFAQYASQPFHVVGGSGATLPLQLVDVSDSSTDGQERFALLFVGPKEPMLAQGIRRLRHLAMGEFELFLVPVGSDARTVIYQAVFNRLVPAKG